MASTPAPASRRFWACAGAKPIIGLPGNPVSALVNGYMLVVPLIEKLLGAIAAPAPGHSRHADGQPASQAGREDWWPVRLRLEGDSFAADPIFGKSNLIFSLAAADGLLKIPPDATGLSAGTVVEVLLV
jgi:molybdopterin molybdotransferase